MILLLLIAGITFGYAALNTTININGKSNISKNTWSVYFDNIKINKGSVSSIKSPTIDNQTTVDFEVKLDKPGDFYEFSIDVVNSGTIDAMIDSIIKEPELTAEQNKYLNYIIEYQNGEQITNNQLLEANNFLRLRIKVEYKKDISASDLPIDSDTLSLGFTINYVQSDGNVITVLDNGKSFYEIVKGDTETVGSEICIGEECFYLVKNKGSSLLMLAKYGLLVGNGANSLYDIYPLDYTTGKQDQTATGSVWSPNFDMLFPWIANVEFSQSTYWWDDANGNFKTGYPTDTIVNNVNIPYVYNENSSLYIHIENYKTYLESLEANILDARLAKISELEELGCSIETRMCTNAPAWTHSMSYWLGSANNNEFLWFIDNQGEFDGDFHYEIQFALGVRPIIEIPIKQR